MFGFTFGQMGAPGMLSALSSSIKSLFVGGTQGAWYRPSQAITSPWYQNSVGTTPVTEVEQPVGLALDRSLGGTVGPELISNGTFDTDINGWSASNANGTLSFLSNKLRVTATATFDAGAKTTTVVSPNKMLAFSFDITTSKANLFFSVISLGGEIAFLGPLAAGTTRISRIGLSGGSGSDFIIRFSQAIEAIGDWFEVDNVSVKLLDGNHATQPTAASRPVLSSRVNLLQGTAELTGVAWSNGPALTVGALEGTIAGVAARRFTSTAVGNSYQVQVVSLPMPGVAYTLRVLTDTSFSGDASFVSLLPSNRQIFASTPKQISPGVFEYLYNFVVAATGETSVACYMPGVDRAAGTTWRASSPQLEIGSVATKYQRTGSLNLLTKTEQADDAIWAKVRIVVTPNVGVAPDGSMTADLLTSTGTAGADSNLVQNFTTVAGQSYTFSGYVRSDTPFQLKNYIGPGYADAPIDVTSNWQRFTVTTIATGASIGVSVGASDTFINGRQVYVWGLQAEAGTVATPYQKVDVPANNYDAVGFPKYLVFDGTQSSLSSATGGGGSAGFFFCAAVKVLGGAGSYRTIFGDRGMGANGYFVQITIDNVLSFGAGMGGAFSVLNGATVINAGSLILVMAWDDGINLNLQLNSEAPISLAHGAIAAGIAGVVLGKQPSQASEYFFGNIYEAVYVRNSGLTPAQRLQVQRQVAAAVGITL